MHFHQFYQYTVRFLATEPAHKANYQVGLLGAQIERQPEDAVQEIQNHWEEEFQVEKEKERKKQIPDFICLDFTLKLKISCTAFYKMCVWELKKQNRETDERKKSWAQL